MPVPVLLTAIPPAPLITPEIEVFPVDPEASVNVLPPSEMGAETFSAPLELFLHVCDAPTVTLIPPPPIVVARSEPAGFNRIPPLLMFRFGVTPVPVRLYPLVLKTSPPATTLPCTVTVPAVPSKTAVSSPALFHVCNDT